MKYISFVLLSIEYVSERMCKLSDSVLFPLRNWGCIKPEPEIAYSKCTRHPAV